MKYPEIKLIAGVISFRSIWQKWNFFSGEKCYVSTTWKWKHTKENNCACEYNINTLLELLLVARKSNIYLSVFPIESSNIKLYIYISYVERYKLINLIKNNVFLLSHGIKSIHRSKLYQQYTHLRKNFLQLLLSKACETFLFRQYNKVYSILWSERVFFAFLEKRRPTRYWLREENLVFYM